MKEMFKKKPQKVIFWSGFFVVILLALIGLGAGYLYKGDRVDPDVLAIVAGEKITKKDLNELIYGVEFKGTVEYPAPVDAEKEKELFEQLVKWALVKDEAKKRNVVITKEDYEKEALERLGEDVYRDFEKSFTPVQKNITKKVIENEALAKKVSDSIVAWREGGLIVARFDKYAGSSPSSYTDVQKAEWEKVKEAKYAEDKAYAEKAINDIYQKLEKKEITTEQALDLTLTDPKMNAEYFKPWTTGLSRKFTKEEFWSGDDMLNNEGVVDEILKLKNGYSKPALIKVYVDNEVEKDGYYLITYITKSNDSNYKSLEEWVHAKEGEEGTVKIYSDKFKEEKKTSFFVKEAKAHAISGDYSHACGTSPSTYSNHWGINSGSSSSTAGLVVYTRYYNSSGNGPYALNEVSYTVTDSSSGSADVVSSPGGTIGTRYNSKSFTTNHNFYRTGGNSAACTQDGYSVLGYGGSPAQNYANWGNGYSLDCTGNTFTVTVSNPSGRTGHWDDNSITVTVTNGDTPSTKTFTWRDNRPPVVAATTHSNNISSPTAFESDDSTASIQLKAKATDADSDDVRYRIAYQKSTDNGTTWSGWTYYPAAGMSGLRTQNTEYTVASYAPSTLGVGLYKWVVMAEDEHGALSDPAGSTNAWTHGDPRYFKVQAALPQSLSCVLVPQTGSVPFKVTVNVTPSNIPGVNADTLYTFNMGDGISSNIQRKSGFNYTYNSAGNYTVTASYGAVSDTCSPQATVSDPRGGSGGEVAP